MHEISVVLEIVKIVEKYAETNNVEHIEKLVLQIGEMSSVIPNYVVAIYPEAVKGTVLQDAALEIETLPANARCKDCEQVFNVKEYKAICPGCGSKELELLSGREFNIKEIVIVDQG